jgi:hypothetical protein
MIRERILKYLESKGISRYKFYQITGLSNGFLDKDGAIGSDKCEIIIYHFNDINPRWLLTGDGEMLNEERLVENPHSFIYKELFEQKENEVKELNREIGRLEAEIKNLKQYYHTDQPNIAAEPKSEFKKRNR